MFGLMKARGSAYVEPVLYGLAGWMLILAAGAFARYIAASTAAHGHRIHLKNAASVVRDLADRLGIQIQNLNTPGFLMYYIITLNNGRKITVKQLEKHPYFFYFSLVMTYDESDNRNFFALPGGISQLLREIRINLSSNQIGFSGVEEPLKEITLSKAVPIAETFGEIEFLNALGEMDSGCGLLLAVTDVRGRMPS